MKEKTLGEVIVLINGAPEHRAARVANYGIALAAEKVRASELDWHVPCWKREGGRLVYLVGRRPRPLDGGVRHYSWADKPDFRIVLDATLRLEMAIHEGR